MPKAPIVKPKGRTVERAHEKDGRIVRITRMDGKEIKREYTGKRLIFPQSAGQLDFGIKKFKRDHPNATHKEIQDYKNGAWQYPPAQVIIDGTGIKPKKVKK